MQRPKKEDLKILGKPLTETDRLEDASLEGWNDAIDEMQAWHDSVIKELLRIVVEDVPHNYQKRLIEAIVQAQKEKEK